MRGRRATHLALGTTGWLAALLFLAAVPQSAPAMFAGVDTYRAASVADSSADKSVTVTCPAGQRVLSAGFELRGAAGHVLVDDVLPDATLTKVTARAAEDETGTDEPWLLFAVAQCAPPPAGLVRVSAVSAQSSAAKNVTATCPAGKRVTGTGGVVSNGTGQIVIDGIVPSADLRSVRVNAFEDQTGTAAQWNLGAYAICSSVQGVERQTTTVPATASGPSRFIYSACRESGKLAVGSGGEIDAGGGQVFMHGFHPDGVLTTLFFAVEDDTGYAANWGATSHVICGPGVIRETLGTHFDPNPKGASIPCTSGRLAIGGGADIDGGLGEAWVHDIGPYSMDSLLMRANGRTSRSWAMRAYSMCATPPAGYEIVTAPGLGSPPFSDRTATPTCPAGKKVIGVGVFSEGTGADGMYQALSPSPSLNSATISMSEVENPADTTWDMTGVAVCATPPPGLELVVRSTETDSEEIKAVTATCPAGKHVLGAGAAVFPATGDVVIDDLRPDALLSKVAVTGIEDWTGFSGDWSARAYAICVSR